MNLEVSESKKVCLIPQVSFVVLQDTKMYMKLDIMRYEENFITTKKSR